MIAGEDGRDYVFTASSLRDGTFGQLSLGSNTVTFMPAPSQVKPRAEFVRLAR